MLANPNAVVAGVLGIADAHPNLRELDFLLPLLAGGGWEGMAFDVEVKSKSTPPQPSPATEGSPFFGACREGTNGGSDQLDLAQALHQVFVGVD